MGSLKNILVAEADERERERIAEVLRSRNHQVVTAADGEEAARHLLSQGPFEIAIFPCILPEKSGLALSREIAARYSGETSTLLLLEVDDPQVRGLARMCGARSVLPRPFDDEELVRLVELAFDRPDVTRLVAEREEKIVKGELLPETSLSVLLGEGSFLDELMDKETGLYNKTYVLIKLEEEFKKSQRYGSPLVCGVLRIALSESEEEAQAELSRIAGALLVETRDTDVVGRVSPRDVLVLLSNTNLLGAKVMARRLFSALGIPTCARLEIGLSVYPSDDIQRPDDLVRAAELGLVKATSLALDRELSSRDLDGS